ENLYWIGRYIERAENTASLLVVNYHANVEAPVIPGAKGIVTEQWAPLLTLTDDEAAFREHFDRADGRTVPEWLAFHPQNSSSIRASLDSVLGLMQAQERPGVGLGPVALGLDNRRGMALLKSVSAYEAFRKRHHVALEARRIAAFLLLDPDFPRSVRHNLAALQGTLINIERL